MSKCQIAPTPAIYAEVECRDLVVECRALLVELKYKAERWGPGSSTIFKKFNEPYVPS